jgi:hypothetical protein
MMHCLSSETDGFSADPNIFAFFKTRFIAAFAVPYDLSLSWAGRIISNLYSCK